jgi:hypothetical protein
MAHPGDDRFLDLLDHHGEFLVGQPHRCLPVDHAVRGGIGVLVGEVAVEIRHQRCRERGERLPVVLARHRRSRRGIDHRLLGAHAIAALHRAAYPLLAHYLQHARVGQHGYVSVHRRRRDVRQAVAQLCGGQRVGVEQ